MPEQGVVVLQQPQAPKKRKKRRPGTIAKAFSKGKKRAKARGKQMLKNMPVKGMAITAGARVAMNFVPANVKAMLRGYEGVAIPAALYFLLKDTGFLYVAAWETGKVIEGFLPKSITGSKAAPKQMTGDDDVDNILAGVMAGDISAEDFGADLDVLNADLDVLNADLDVLNADDDLEYCPRIGDDMGDDMGAEETNQEALDAEIGRINFAAIARKRRALARAAQYVRTPQQKRALVAASRLIALPSTAHRRSRGATRGYIDALPSNVRRYRY